MKKYFIQVTMILVTLIIGFIAYPNLPEQVPLHWGLNGFGNEVHKLFMLLFFPTLMAFTHVTISLLLKGHKGIRNQKTLLFIDNGMLILLLILQLLFLASGLGWSLNQNFFIGILIGSVTLLIANFMPKSKTNFLFGLRTPWTLKDERVWLKANRFSGKLLFFVGILIVSLSFITPKEIAMISLILILTAAFIATLASYIIYRNIKA
ncbi:hypothetical protein AJ85_04070 [Alkalihalobacillus alcalophilus ATCC 27647 = CGMCC 1.3604]|uniref:Protein export transporter n=1 Tax=Alkalihalobacillus alcalophilus ATCC 27647 = CGMCC 1.3604 TaxID=1218173 RepID=J8T6Y9_ALKAL|nr:SdpI family protein [Alkalihalobacillus alcalophilus]AFV25924.1 protein export transporter [Alkalihalobacillus alcalophilus ATCC 27647 = CGMCC 1.3604]KGA98376.1 hypothetical protein BALCAV_0204660 [Alkalihalobacillus alcalophilus ATCC 27647 = CGMCC 1.3604]MED1563675.1 SdpI family protein [Alkalihalobacillus alcalophilus]THG91627.1 hypothetical protein AJ85_04070 [Alkalihalobacillus alcalophilus ATCC 27647 = CGMCC 1.3604]